MIQQLTQMLKNQASQTRMIQLNRAVAALKYVGGRGGGGGNVSKKCRPPWLADGKTFKF